MKLDKNCNEILDTDYMTLFLGKVNALNFFDFPATLMALAQGTSTFEAGTVSAWNENNFNHLVAAHLTLDELIGWNVRMLETTFTGNHPANV